MLQGFISFISDIFCPEYAVAGGIPYRFEDEKKAKPGLKLFKGEGGNSTPTIANPPAPPPVNLPSPPAPPPPPPPPQLANAVDVALAQRQSQKATAGQFGYNASLLGNGGADPAQKPVVGSLLGNGLNAPK